MPGVRDELGLEVGHPRGRLERVRRHATGRDEAEDAPLVGLTELVEDLLGGRTAVQDLRDDLGRPHDVGHDQRVALEPRDRGHAVAEDVDDTVRDLLEDHLGVGGGVDASHQLRQTTQRPLVARHVHLRKGPPGPPVPHDLLRDCRRVRPRSPPG